MKEILSSRKRLLGLVFCLTAVRAWDEERMLDSVNSQSRADPFVDPVALYFSYGSNMLEKRMRIKCPDATLYGPAILPNHRLDFTMEVPWWNGAVATICKDPEASVWGVLWIIKITDMDRLDEQEGVSAGWYHPEEVRVLCEGKKKLKAITYVQNHNPRKLHPLDIPPPDRQPSLTYLKAMITGAVQVRLPDDYIQYLYTLRHNGRVATQQLINNIDRPAKNKKILL